MNEYAAVVFAACCIAGVLSLFTYKEGRAESLALGVITLFLIASPIADAVGVGELPSLAPTPELDTDGGYTARLEEAYAEGLRLAISDRFNIRKEDVSVTLYRFDANSISAEEVRVYLSGAGVLADYRAIEAYIGEITDGKCRVEIEIKK